MICSTSPGSCWKSLMRPINKIVIHHSASDRDTTTPAKINQWHLDRGWSGIGYHWVITGDGALHVGRRETKSGAHTKGHNKNSIGICVTGNFETESPTREQWNILKIFMLRSLSSFNLTPSDIYAHRELSPTLCCGQKLFDMLVNWRNEEIAKQA